MGALRLAPGAVVRLIDDRPRQYPMLLELARCRRLSCEAVISWGWRRHHGNIEVVARFTLAERSAGCH